MIPAKKTSQPTTVQPSNPPTVWSYKPWWCQPWSILLTGNSLIIGSWVLFQRIWVTALVAIPILTWMGFFLLVYPRLLQAGVAEDGTISAGGEMTE
jgi:hypothetical protein